MLETAPAPAGYEISDSAIARMDEHLVKLLRVHFLRQQLKQAERDAAASPTPAVNPR